MIGAKKRFKVLERDNFRCQYCGKNGKDVSLEVDHIIPKSKGGTDDFSNLITCCRECNIGKGKDIVGVSNGLAKIKIADHESAMIKKFFNQWNRYNFGTIDRNNLTFLSGFVKLLYGKTLIQIMNEDYIEIDEFDKGGKVCDDFLKKFDKMIWENTLLYFIEKISQNGIWLTDDINARLNYMITERISEIGLPPSFNFKHSLFPKQIEEWQQND